MDRYVDTFTAHFQGLRHVLNGWIPGDFSLVYSDDVLALSTVVGLQGKRAKLWAVVKEKWCIAELQTGFERGE